MIPSRDDLVGVDDLVAEFALARRARERRHAQAPRAVCGRRFTHPHWPTRFDTRGFLVVCTCQCLLPSGHDGGCVCEHQVERHVYRVDPDGREHYAPRPLGAR